MQDKLSEEEAGQLEIELTRRYGFLADGTGTLVNARHGSTAPRERVRQETAWSNRSFSIRFWRRLKKEGEFLPNAKFWRIIAHNPKKNGKMGASFSYENFELYPPVGVVTTIAAHNAKALAEGFTAEDQRGHLSWDAAQGFIAVEGTARAL